MERDEIHDLSAAYALDALDPGEQAAFEAHLADCAACRAEVASLRGTAGSLAVAAAGATPPPALRGRILAEAAGNGTTVVPLRRRRPFQATLVAAAAALALAAGFGTWAASLRADLADARHASAENERATELLIRSGTRHHRVEGADGVLAVAPNGEAALVLRNVPRAPEGRTYEAWVVVGDRATPAGTFEAGVEPTVAPLELRVPEGALVGVTVEPDGGSATPTGEMIITAPTS